MINQARTLLLNRSGAEQPSPSFFLQEYVDPLFTPITLPSFLVRSYNVLVGANADDAFANFRMWQYMHILHSTDFAEYVYALDPRVTYLNDRSIVDSQYLPVVTPLTPSAQGIPFYVQGQAGLAGANQLLFQWNIEVINGLVVRTTDLRTNAFVDTIVTILNNLTSPIALAGQKTMSVQIGAPAPLPVGATWTLQTLAQPNFDLSSIIDQLKVIGDDSLYELFGRNVPPYNTFRQVWEKEADQHYQLSGYLLAHIYRVNEVRRNV